MNCPLIVKLSTRGTIEVMRRSMAITEATLIELERAKRSIDEIRCPNCENISTTDVCGWCGSIVAGAR